MLPKTTKTAKTSNEAVNATLNPTDTTPSPLKQKAVTEAKKVVAKSGHSQYGDVQIVTSLNLKRRLVHNAYRGSFFMHEDVYKHLSVMGIAMGVTWDEALRGIIDMHIETSQNNNGLSLFVPALNL